MNTTNVQSDHNIAEIHLTIADHLNWIVDLSHLQRLPTPLLDTLVALDEDLRTQGRQLQATGLHVSHIGGREFPKLVDLYNAKTNRPKRTVNRCSCIAS